MKGKYSLVVLIAAFGALLFQIPVRPTIVHADEPAATPDNGKCISCHEDLYFLHDTGNWFCLRESPMSCVECHGGDPSATTQEQAHADRTAHPVLNEDISKCQECHPDKCTERVRIFKATAGIGRVWTAKSYTPYTGMEVATTNSIERADKLPLWSYGWNLLSVLLLIVAALAAYVIHQKHNLTR